MFQITIVYHHPDDPDAFDCHYKSTHIPLVDDIPDVAGFTMSHCETLDGSTPSAYALAQLTFASKDAASQAFGSPAGQAAAGDVANFATGGATMLFTEVPAS
jgi:uncharacterized protein (TIGR02118 family)